MPELAYVNGVVGPIEQAVVSVEDRGYQFGDAVYEVIASYNGRLFYLEAHMQRLARSLTALQYTAVDLEALQATVLDLYDQAQLPRAAVYIQVSRGVAPRNHAYDDALTPQIVMTVREIGDMPVEYRQQGVGVMSVPDTRWGRCDIKTVQLLANSMAKQQALDRGLFDAIFVAPDGTVREATSSNVMIVSQGKVITHPLEEIILPGITRSQVLRLAATGTIKTEERYYDIEELYAAQEVLLTGTITEVLPVVRVDDRPIGDGRVGPVARQLLASLHDEIKGA
jgi:D-alanine transaminase